MFLFVAMKSLLGLPKVLFRRGNKLKSVSGTTSANVTAFLFSKGNNGHKWSTGRYSCKNIRGHESILPLTSGVSGNSFRQLLVYYV